jgi:type IV pilus assembly protein PilA
MVVVLIIAILLAIAIPTFLGARDRANDRAAQSSLRNGLTAAKTIYTDEQDYTKATAASLFAIEPSLTYVGSASGSSDFKQVSVNGSAADVFVGSTLSKTKTCFLIKDSSAAGTQYAKVANPTTCNAALSGVTWSDKW